MNNTSSQTTLQEQGFQVYPLADFLRVMRKGYPEEIYGRTFAPKGGDESYDPDRWKAANVKTWVSVLSELNGKEDFLLKAGNAGGTRVKEQGDQRQLKLFQRQLKLFSMTIETPVL